MRNIPRELYEAAVLDGATRWQNFARVTWPLIWPVTVLCLTIQLILQLKIFDQVYLFALGGRTAATMVLVQYIFEQAFQRNSGGYAATIAVAHVRHRDRLFRAFSTSCCASGARDDATPRRNSADARISAACC